MARQTSFWNPEPAGAKGTYIQRVALSSTQGPGVKIDPATVTTQGTVGA